MTDKLSEFGKVIIKDINTFAKREILEASVKSDREGYWPESLYKRINEMGYGAIFIPKEYSKLELTLHDVGKILEELSFWDTGIAVTFMTNMLYSAPLIIAGNKVQKKQAFNALISGFGGFALTEETAGSDISGIKTKAELVNEKYILNGRKIFVTNGAISDNYVVFAVTDHGLGAFIVPASSEGVSFGDEEDKLGIRNSKTCDMELDGVEIPKENLIGEIGMGMKIALSSLEIGRIWCAAVALGICKRAIYEAKKYAKNRIQFKKTISRNPVIISKIADMEIKYASSRYTVYNAIEKLERGEDISMASSIAKCISSDSAVFCANEGLQIFGGNGFLKDFPMEKLLRDSRIFQIFEGTNEIQRLIIGRKSLGL